MQAGARRESEDSRRQNVFLLAFLACLVLISVPSKYLAYLAPPVYLLILFLGRDFQVLTRAVVLNGLFVGLSALSLLIDAARGNQVNVPGMLLAVLTFLPLTVLLAERCDRRFDPSTIHCLTRITAWFVIFQSLVGVLQFVWGGNPDGVCGTAGLLDFYSGGMTIVQVYFTFVVFGMLLFLFVVPKTPLTCTAILAGMLVCGLAQSGHQTVFFAVALGGLGLLRLRRPAMALACLAAAVSVMLLASYCYPETWNNVGGWYDKVVHGDDSSRRLAAVGSLEVMDDLKNLCLGAGMGQFSSRAALISSNVYLTARLPAAMTGQSDYFAQVVRPAMFLFDIHGEGSAVSKPYSSWLTFSVEFGPLIVLGGLIWLAVAMWRNHRLGGRRTSLTGMMANAGLLFFVLCCAIENYAEFPGAIFLPGLLYVAAVSRARNDDRA